jgi:glycosyltransferase involved in cell wall biosynthesis
MRVALLRDFDEQRMFGMRFYAERLRDGVASRCDLSDIYPRPRSAPGSEVTRPLWTLLVKQLLYPLQVGRLRADVVHVVDQSHAHLVRWIRGAATVVTCHDLWGLRHGSLLRRFAYRQRVLAMRQATRVIAVSRHSCDEAIRLGIDPDRISVVGNHIDRSFFVTPSSAETSAAAARLGVAGRRFFLHVGNSLSYKNIPRLLRALGAVGRSGGGEPLLVKAGALLTAEQARVARQEGVAVRALGEVAASDLRALYHLADCLVHPSLHEGFAWPVAEALACGLPVIAGDAGAIPEVTAGTALLVDPKDVSGIAEAIRRLVLDPALRADLAARGKRRADELVRGDPGADVVEVYRIAAGEHRRGA